MHASPLRAASQVVWTGLVGAAALVLAAWIAPHLWKKDHSTHRRPTTAATQSPWGPSYSEPEVEACCPIHDATTERDVVREYLPLKKAEEQESRRRRDLACKPCYASEPITSAYGTGEELASRGYTYDGTFTGTYTYGPSTGRAWIPDPDTTWSPSTYVPEAPPAPPPTVTPPATTAAPVPVVPPKPTTVATAPPPPKPIQTAAAPTTSPKPAAPPPPKQPAIAYAPPPPAAPRSDGTPWRWTLGACIAAIALHLAARGTRRALTLRHLEEPFWRESIDQRVSNHWQRMLIGLRDAGIQPRANEQPLAFARRVGIESATTCATILERVRHGACIDDGDLDAMRNAASDVFHAARKRAGALGRAAAWLRWPLA